jgi:hypothetical protein
MVSMVSLLQFLAMRVVLTSRMMMSRAVSVLSLLQYTNKSNLPHKIGLQSLFVKFPGNEGSPHFSSHNVPGSECHFTTYFSTEITATNLIRVVSVVSS